MPFCPDLIAYQYTQGPGWRLLPKFFLCVAMVMQLLFEVIMILLSKLKFPYASFPCLSLGGISSFLLCGVQFADLRLVGSRSWRWPAMEHHQTTHISNFIPGMCWCTKQRIPYKMRTAYIRLFPFFENCLTIGQTHLHTLGTKSCG